MNVFWHANFKKTYRKRIANNPKLVQKTEERIQLFLSKPEHPSLNRHRLKGKYKDKMVFSVTGDIRIVYKYESEHVVRFFDIGSHSQVY